MEHATARFTMPSVVFEVQRDFVLGARVEGSGRGARRLARMAVRSVDATAVDPHLSRENVANVSAVRAAVSGVAGAVGSGGSRFGLVIPDGTVRVSLFKFETLSEDLREAEALVLWRMRSMLPFSTDEARLTFQMLAREPSGVEVLAVAASHSILREYESALDPVNGGPSLVVPATLCLLPLVPEEAFGQLLVHICSGSMTSVLIAGQRVGIWRTREVGRAGDLGAEVAAETARAIASAVDHLGVAVHRVWMCVRPPENEEFVAAVAFAAAPCEVRQIEAPEGPASVLTGAARLTYDQFGAPLAGLVATAG